MLSSPSSLLWAKSSFNERSIGCSSSSSVTPSIATISLVRGAFILTGIKVVSAAVDNALVPASVAVVGVMATGDMDDARAVGFCLDGTTPSGDDTDSPAKNGCCFCELLLLLLLGDCCFHRRVVVVEPPPRGRFVGEATPNAASLGRTSPAQQQQKTAKRTLIIVILLLVECPVIIELLLDCCYCWDGRRAYYRYSSS